jgi:hypothetical protein
MAMEAAVTRVGDVKLGVAVQPHPEGFQALALVTRGADAASVLDSHAHEYLGIFPDPAAARRACEQYARAWSRRQKARTVPVVEDPCACGPIEP